MHNVAKCEVLILYFFLMKIASKKPKIKQGIRDDANIMLSTIALFVADSEGIMLNITIDSMRNDMPYLLLQQFIIMGDNMYNGIINAINQAPL